MTLTPRLSPLRAALLALSALLTAGNGVTLAQMAPRITDCP